jgi:hypothetical protein
MIPTEVPGVGWMHPNRPYPEVCNMVFRCVLVVLMAVLSGCVSISPMAFDKATQKIDVSQKSIVLMTFDVSRADDSRYVPHPTMLNITKTQGTQSSSNMQHFSMSEKADSMVASDGRSVYAVRMALEPGRYQLFSIGGMANAFPFIGTFWVPLLMDIDVSANSVTYVGHVQAQLRRRRDGEFRAGPVIPLIDQSVTGMSGGTFDVEVKDASNEDIELFRSTFPALGAMTISTHLLPPFDRSKAQRAWDGDSAKADASVQEKDPSVGH